MSRKIPLLLALAISLAALPALAQSSLDSTNPALALRNRPLDLGAGALTANGGGTLGGVFSGYATINLGTGALTAATITPLQGTCDILAAAGTPCVAAHSVTRRMFLAYAGPLFQLTRASDGTTANIGSTAAGIYNAAQVATFCAGTSCYFSEIFDQTANNNVLPQATVANMAPFAVHPANGLPVVWTSGTNAFYRNRSSTTNIPTGTAASTVYYVRGTEMWSSCCGEYGRMEAPFGSTVSAGMMFALAWDNWTGNLISGVGAGVDLEGSVPSASIVGAPGISTFLAKYQPTTNTVQVKGWSAVTGNFYPLREFIPTATPIVEDGISLGEGGDGSAAPSEFFEGVITNGATTSATDTLVAANIAAFYSINKSVVLGPIDLVLNNGCAGVLCNRNAANPHFDMSEAAAGAWGMRRLSASYTGFIATIRRASDNTTANIGATDMGDFDDATAQAFCAGTTCYATVLKNQAISVGKNDTNPSVYDMVQPTAALQPVVAFNVVNGKSALQSTGTQFLCTSDSITGIAPWSMIAVAERTGNTTAVTYALSSNGTQGDIGYAAAANTAQFIPGTSGTTLTMAATDSSPAFLAATEDGHNGGTANLTFGVNNGTPATAAASAYAAIVGSNCILSASYYSSGSIVSSDVMTGYFLEGLIAETNLSAAQITALYNNAHAYYGGAF